jgi:hypothetical protein
MGTGAQENVEITPNFGRYNALLIIQLLLLLLSILSFSIVLY